MTCTDEDKELGILVVGYKALGWQLVPRQLDQVETPAIKVIQEEEVRQGPIVTDYSKKKILEKVQNHNFSFLEMSLS